MNKYIFALTFFLGVACTQVIGQPKSVDQLRGKRPNQSQQFNRQNDQNNVRNSGTRSTDAQLRQGELLVPDGNANGNANGAASTNPHTNGPPQDPNAPDVPLGGIGFLIAGGAFFGAKKFLKKK